MGLIAVKVKDDPRPSVLLSHRLQLLFLTFTSLWSDWSHSSDSTEGSECTRMAAASRSRLQTPSSPQVSCVLSSSPPSASSFHPLPAYDHRQLRCHTASRFPHLHIFTLLFISSSSASQAAVFHFHHISLRFLHPDKAETQISVRSVQPEHRHFKFRPQIGFAAEP